MRFWRSSWRSMLELSKCWKEKAAKAMTVRQCSHTIACLTKCGHLGARQSKPQEGLEGTPKFANYFFFLYCIAVVPSLLQTISMCVMNDMTSLCGMLSYVWTACVYNFSFFCNLVGISIISTSFHQQLASDEHCKIFPCSKFSVVARLSYSK